MLSVILALAFGIIYTVTEYILKVETYKVML